MVMSSRHIAVAVQAPADVVYRVAGDPRRLPEWAAGLAAGEVRAAPAGEHWLVDSPMGPVEVRFCPPNEFGVLDHTVLLPEGVAVLNQMRVLSDGPDASELVFTVRHRAGMSESQFDQDTRAVAADLGRLRDLIELS